MNGVQKEEIQQHLKGSGTYDELYRRIGEFIPEEADFCILQFSPEGSIRILKPVQRPGFSEAELKKDIRKNHETGTLLDSFFDYLPRPVLLEISRSGNVQKVSVPEQ